MTNKEKFIEIMKQVYRVELKIKINSMCPPVCRYGDLPCNRRPCEICQEWWSKEYKEVKQNDN